jgi:lipopolysaccharide export system ATP-binding protein
MAILRAENLKKSYGYRLVVKGIDIAVNTGEIIALLGRNGAGKTTTFQMMVGLIKPDSGTIYLDETNISRHTSNQRANDGITYLPQENSVFLKTTVEKNLKMILELKKYKKDEMAAITDQLLEELGLQSLRKQPAFSLSGGERRRLEICRALVLDPKFLLLDEPFTGIDPLTIVEIQRILLRLKKKGIGIILSDHNVRDTLKITDNGYVIDQGEILIKGNPQQIASDKIAKERFLGENFKLGDEIADYNSSENR